MNFEAFIQGSKAVETVKFVASERFTENGKPIEWEIKPIGADLDELIRKECMKKIPISGKRGQYTQEFDNEKYIMKMCVASTVYPNLKDAAFQDAMGVMSDEALLLKLLLAGELAEYKTKVMEVNGYDLSMEELVEEGKN